MKKIVVLFMTLLCVSSNIANPGLNCKVGDSCSLQSVNDDDEYISILFPHQTNPTESR